jgi:hypothetical protein
MAHGRGEEDNNFVECMRDAFFFQKVKQPTRHRDGQISTLIALVLVSGEDLLTEIEHAPPFGKSDHEVLVFSI